MSTESAPSQYDENAWQKLQENRLSWNGYDEQEDTIWPCNRKEINKTKKVLNSINYNKLSDEAVIEEYDLQKDLIEAMKKELPNNRLKMLPNLIILLGIIFFYIWYAHPPQLNSFNQDDWIVSLTSEFVSSSDFKPKFNLQKKKIKAGTHVTPLAMGEQNRAKVQLESGEVGYMHLASFSGVKTNSTTIKGTQLFSSANNKKEIAKLDSISPRILSIPKIDSENNHYIKVKTQKGRIGYIYDNHIKYLFSDSLPEISRNNILPVASTKIEKWKGQSISDIEDQYTPITSYINDKAYWENIRIIDDTIAYSGVMVYVNSNGIIDSVQYGQKEKLFGSMSFFPFWRMIASAEPFYGTVDMYYEQNDRVLNIGWWENLRSTHWSLKFIIWIIELILKILWFIIKISILFIPVMVIGVIISHLERPSYRASINIVLSLLLLVYLYISIFTLMQNNFELIAMIILFVAAIANFLVFSSHLNSKCYQCGNWDGEITEKTDFLGQSVSVQYGSRNKYTGSDTRFTGTSHNSSTNTTTHHYQTTNYYEKVKTKDTYKYDNFKDHKMCKYCGMRWKVSYKILKGEKHEEF